MEMFNECHDFDVALYHGGCNDGLAAAWIMEETAAKSHFRTVGVSHGEDPPIGDVYGRRVALVDFCFPPEQMQEIMEVAEIVKVYDHHASAERHLDELPDDIIGVFDKERSGARIAWDVFGPNKSPTKLVKYVEDRDLWRNKYPASKAIAEWLSKIPRTTDAFNVAAHELEDNFDFVLTQGYNMYESKDNMTDLLAQDAQSILLFGKSGLARRGNGNVASLLGNKLAKQSDDGFAIVWDWSDEGGIKLSFRATDDGPDMSKFAEELGGGGHSNASGAHIPEEDVHDTNNEVAFNYLPEEQYFQKEGRLVILRNGYHDT
jgi:oligoribonuclease NrnB/cAMP/cGMP phosphodiesterase (DHH superfamily)